MNLFEAQRTFRSCPPKGDPICCGLLKQPDKQKLATERDCGGHIEAVGRSRLDNFVDFFELLLRGVALDMDGVAQAVIAGLH